MYGITRIIETLTKKKKKKVYIHTHTYEDEAVRAQTYVLQEKWGKK